MADLGVVQSQRVWWKESVVYQMYPTSFRDTNEDGHGDVRGITQALDYLKSLGVDKSPQVNMGYDISDYRHIDPKYGTLKDVDELITQLRQRNMKFMMDLVVNHTSNQYIWRKGRKDKEGKLHPPNNWCRTLDTSQSAWEWDEKTQEYYLSIFSAEQPDLNWESNGVRTAVHDIMRFWLDRGVAGFRMDVIDHISKVQSFPDAKAVATGQYLQPGDDFFANGPRLDEFLHEMRQVLDEYDTISVGEMPFVNDEEETIRTVGRQGSLNMILLFEILNVDNQPGRPKWSYQEWTAFDMARIHERTQRLIEQDGWNAIFCENHDMPRSISRFADDSDERREYAAKMICTKHNTLGGTQYLYQGQELGMRNIPADRPIEEYKDIETQNYWKATPMQWESSPNAGFCLEDVKLWMRVNDDYRRVNVQAPLEDPQSVLAYWKLCIEFRKSHKDVFVCGGFEILDAENKDVVAFRRFSAKEKWITITNFYGSGSTVGLRPWEAIIGRCSMPTS
ncbi:alpha-glucosidase [Xylaria sp. FL0064]|nr:alpha-glucosidase [Xylaria sp. FL0064]